MLLHSSATAVTWIGPQRSRQRRFAGLKFCQGERPRIRIFAQTVGEAEHVICVSDNGIGIAPENADRIFEPFRRLRSPDDFAGSGLGLTTCQKIVKRHGGRIWCVSRLGEGAKFHVALPAAIVPIKSESA